MDWRVAKNMDREHRLVSTKLLSSLQLLVTDAPEEDDTKGIADLYISDGDWTYPVGCKKRGRGAGVDFQLSAWTEARGGRDLDEFKTAGLKHYSYQMKDAHYFIQFPKQEILNALLPTQWRTIRNGRDFEFLNDFSGVRERSATKLEQIIQQGLVFVPRDIVWIKAKWDFNRNLFSLPYKSPEDWNTMECLNKYFDKKEKQPIKAFG